MEALYPRTGRMAFVGCYRSWGSSPRRRRPSLPRAGWRWWWATAPMPTSGGGCPTWGGDGGRHGGRPRARRVRRDHGQECRPRRRWNEALRAKNKGHRACLTGPWRQQAFDSGSSALPRRWVPLTGKALAPREKGLGEGLDVQTPVITMNAIVTALMVSPLCGGAQDTHWSARHHGRGAKSRPTSSCSKVPGGVNWAGRVAARFGPHRPKLPGCARHAAARPEEVVHSRRWTRSCDVDVVTVWPDGRIFLRRR